MSGMFEQSGLGQKSPEILQAELTQLREYLASYQLKHKEIVAKLADLPQESPNWDYLNEREEYLRKEIDRIYQDIHDKEDKLKA